MIGRLPKVSEDARCHRKTGWLPDVFSDQCREILCKHIYDTIQEQFNDVQMKQLHNQKQQEANPISNATTTNTTDVVEDTFDLLEISDSDDDTGIFSFYNTIVFFLN